MKKFIIIVTSLEARSESTGNPIITPAGTRFVVVNEPEGWVEASSIWYTDGKIPVSAKLFDTVEEAKKFAQRWKGHPWWCKPSGEFKIIEVEKTYREIFSGYRSV